jgi:hypothetical protein
MAAPIQLNRGAAGEDASARAGSFQGRIVSSASNQGIANAEITFQFARGVLSATSGRDGAFHLEPSEVGTYRLASVIAEGFLPFAPEWGRSPITLQARPGEKIHDVVLYLSPAVEYLGVVLDPEGKRVPRARAILLNSGEGETALAPLPDNFTADEHGEFHFRAPRGALLEATHPDFGPGRAAVNQSVQASRRLELSLTIKRELGRRESIAGLVFDPSGAALAGAEVTAIAQNRRWSRWGRASATRTDPDGRFQIQNLAPGQYAVSAGFPGYAAARAESVDSGTDALVLRLSTGSLLSGRVRDGATSSPVVAFTLSIQKVRSTLEREPLTAAAFMDAQGKYEISGLPEGTYAAVATGYGYAPSREVVFTNSAGSQTTIDFELEQGATVFGSVIGRVSRRPLGGAQVSVEGQLNETSVIAVLSSTVTDGNGRFELRGAASGRGSIVASLEGHHSRIQAGLSFENGRRMGPLVIELTPTAEGEEPGFELEGIGASLSARGDVLIVGGLVAGGGAALAGIAIGDQILAIEGQPVAELGFGGAIQQIRGPEGSCLSLTVRRAADDRLQQVTACRRRVQG